MALAASIFLTAILNIERHQAVCVPHSYQARMITTGRKTLLTCYVLPTIMLACLLNIPRLVYLLSVCEQQVFLWVLCSLELYKLFLSHSWYKSWRCLYLIFQIHFCIITWTNPSAEPNLLKLSIVTKQFNYNHHATCSMLQVPTLVPTVPPCHHLRACSCLSSHCSQL